MKWIDLTKASGDDGLTQFGAERLPKGSPIFDLLGEMDTLCATIGMCMDNLVHPDELQADFRTIMGMLHTVTNEEKLRAILDAWTLDLETICTYMDEVGQPPSGWANYDNTWYLACCQARKVERVFQQFGSITDGDIILAILNRASKLLYMLGVKNGRKGR